MTDPNAGRRMRFMRTMTDVEERKAAGDAWGVVHKEIEARAKAKKPHPKQFEVMHEIFVGRDAFIDALMEGKSPAEASNIARARVSLPIPEETC